MKTCSLCDVEKPLEEFGWRKKGTPKAYRDARCKKCKSQTTLRCRAKKLEAELLRNEEPETVCPCDLCFKQMNCEAECASFRCWSEHGV